jgi:predicted small integral membrane protein
MMDLSWMGWTQPTAIFFGVIASLLVALSTWEYFSPGGGPRVGILRFETTRGDRLFISLLGSAFICLAWLGFIGANLWWALALCLGYAIIVFWLV